MSDGTGRGARRARSLAEALLSLALLVGAWAALAAALDDRTLPPPTAVWDALVAEARSGELAFHLGATLARVTAAFLVAMAIGGALGIWLGTSPGADRFLDPWLILLLNVPALVIIVLAYVWFGLNEAAAVGAVAVNKIPNVAVTLREGARALSAELDEMATVYRFGRWKRLRHVTLPQLQPFLAAAARSGVALIWKIVLVVELLGRSNGVGFQIHLYFQLFDVATILAYTFAFVAVMLAVEYALIQPFERRSNRWRAPRARRVRANATGVAAAGA